VSDKEILTVLGAKCPKGKKFAHQEINNPHRNIATSVLVKGGKLPLASVRLTAPIPRSRIFEMMEVIKKVVCDAPVMSGQILIKNALNLGVDVICTKQVERDA
jgi:CxxC motif-containing protein